MGMPAAEISALRHLQKVVGSRQELCMQCAGTFLAAAWRARNIYANTLLQGGCFACNTRNAALKVKSVLPYFQSR